MTSRPKTPLLDTVNTPDDLRKLGKDQLRQLSDELRAEMIDAVGQTGGHLGSGLGVVELTTAIHYVFNTPEDKLVWDVGHQCYPHKILTGRRDRIRTLRQGGGLSGFTKRAESEYDPFGAAHSSTSISAALGFAMANKMQDRPGRGIAVIGDGAMSAGMAYEAMNNAGALDARLIVILNDNDMSIAPPVGGLSAYLARVVSSGEYLGLRSLASKVAKKMHRRIMLSSSYRMSSAPGGRALRRMEAEAFRDAVLAVSGQLNPAPPTGAPPAVKAQDPSPADLAKNRKVYEEYPHRSIYLPVVRSHVYDLFTLLDFPNSTTPVGRRDHTTVATQALLMLNNPFLMEKAAQIEMPINRTSATMVTTTVHFAAGLSKPSE